MTDVLNIKFFDRKVNTEGKYGSHIRMNLRNGHLKLSESVSKALGVKPGDNFGIAFLGGKAYIGKRDGLGLTVSKNYSSNSGSLSKEAESLFKDKIKEGNTILIFGVDTEKSVAAQDGEEKVSLFEMTFKESLQAKKAPNRKSAITAAAPKK